MAKRRIVNTRYWDDDFISAIDKDGKLFYLYLITNPANDLCGVYELPKAIMAAHTKIDLEKIDQLLVHFQSIGKVIYVQGWVILVNQLKYIEINPSIAKGIKRGLETVPEHVLQTGYSLSPVWVQRLTYLNSSFNLSLTDIGQGPVDATLMGKEFDVEESFDQFWDAYPNKKKKKDAHRVWLKIAKNHIIANDIIKHVQRMATTEDWSKEKGKFVPHPTTYLNGERWNEDIPDMGATTSVGGIKPKAGKYAAVGKKKTV